MTDHAIVIGIDTYANPEWNLHSAVRDAVAFAAWVTEPGAGRATTETLTLLLSPRDGAAVPRDFAHATSDAIHNVFTRYARKGEGRDADRLWVFYAGHGIHKPGGGFDAYPVLVPADVEDLQDYLWDNPLALSKYVPAMQLQPPAAQLFFIDACRGVADTNDAVTATTVLHFDISEHTRSGGAAPARQAALHATTAGENAREVRLHGIFSEALVEGLRGRGPMLRPSGDDEWALTLLDLSAFVAKRVEDTQNDRLSADEPRRVQVPSPSLFGFTGDEPLVRFAHDQVPRAQLRLLVEPAEATRSAAAALRVRSPATGRLIREEPQGPPLRDGAVWDLLYRLHRVEVEASGFEPWARLIDLGADTTELAVLTRQDVVRGAAESVERPQVADEPSGRIVARSADPLTLVELLDESGELIAAANGTLTRGVGEGAYRIRATTPGRAPVERQVYVTSHTEEVDVDHPVELPGDLVEALNAAHIHTVDGMSDASEVFDGWAATSLGSVLAWAAWASRFPESADGTRLRSLGVDPLPDTTSSGAYVQVLVGDAEHPDWVDQVSVAFGRAGAEELRDLLPVPGLQTHAAQWAGEVPQDGGAVVVAGPDLRRTSLPVPALPGYVAVVIVAAEAGRQIEIHRYLHPLDPLDHGHPGFSDLVRHQELNWRGLEQRRPFLPGEAENLLADERLDPLSLAIVGYRLVREGRQQLLAMPTPGDTSVVARLVDRAPGLADVHVLDALAGAGDDAMQRGAEAGVPLVADGYSALFDAALARAAASGLPPPAPDRPLVQGGAWTLLDAAEQVMTPTPQAVPADAIGATPWADLLARSVAATARIEAPDATVPFTGTAMLVAPTLLATPEHVVGTAILPVPDDGAAFAPGWEADFGSGRRAGLERLLLRTTAGPAIGGPWHILRVALVALREAPRVNGVDVDWEHEATVGTRIAVVGHSFADPKLPPTAIEAAFGNMPRGEKFIIPGEIVEVRADIIRYEAFTTNGMSGGAVVELASGRVIGLHFGGRFDAGAKYGFAVPMSFLQPLLRGEIERFDREPQLGGTD